jgi:8-amino-7-oxononanoate synthase
MRYFFKKEEAVELMENPEGRFVKYLKDAESCGLKRGLKEIYPISARECMVEGVNDSCLDFSSNNYLGIADHPYLKEEAIRWTRIFGTGSRASRLVSGTFSEYIDLEKRIAEWKGSEASLIIGSGYMANTGIISAVADRKSVIFADKLNHASLNAGAILSGAKFIRYSHGSIDELSRKFKIFDENRLAKSLKNEYRSILESTSEAPDSIIISDTVFSMDGDVVDLEKLVEFAKSKGALLYLDDAHATGLFGERGEGLAHGKNANLAMGTFSKAMGCYGAYVACSEELKDYLVNRCGSFVYTTAMPPGVYGAISAAVELVQTEEFCDIRRDLLKRSSKLAGDIRSLGYETGNTSTPIIPVIVGDADKCVRISQFLLDRNIFAVAIRPPTVPKNSARLRVSINAAHKNEDFERLLDALKDAKRSV